MFCKNCGQQLQDGAAVCMRCGFAVGTGANYCANCGQGVLPGQSICTQCGFAIVGPDGVAPGMLSDKSKLVAGLLAIFLGSWGVHNFYLGQTKRALIQLLVSLLTCGIGATAMGIWALVEGIMILMGHDGYKTDAEGKFLKD